MRFDDNSRRSYTILKINVWNTEKKHWHFLIFQISSTRHVLLLKSFLLACEQALLFGRAKRVSRERASERRSREGQRKGELVTISHKISFVLRSFLGPSLARSREARFAHSNRRACSQASFLQTWFTRLTCYTGSPRTENEACEPTGQYRGDSTSLRCTRRVPQGETYFYSPRVSYFCFCYFCHFLSISFYRAFFYCSRMELIQA